MKLNPDCIRDILLEVEDQTDYTNSLSYSTSEPKPKRWNRYDHAEIIYHIKQCERSELLVDVMYYEDGDYIEISDLSPEGHQFLANVRQDSIWNNTKAIANKVGSKSLGTLLQISTAVITELIKAQCGII